VLGVLVATATADVGPSTAPAPPPVSDPARAPAVPPAPDVDPFATARIATAAIDQLVQGASVGHVSVAALDVATGRSFDYAPDTPIRTASVVKLDVLAALLLQGQDDGRPPSAEARALATRMIEQSDNEAASRLWEDLGGVPALDAANRRLGLRATHLVDRWGSSTTSASDQLALLAALHSSGPLDPASRSYARDLMTRVVDEQRWGVSAAAEPGTTAALKNGWAPADSDDGRWAVGSVGIITVDGSPVLLAVLTERQPSRDAGIQLVEALSRIAAQTVTSMSPAAAAPR
jgi:beta-lactamase class A